MAKKGFELLHEDLIREIAQKAKRTDRKRINYNFHEFPDHVQRMLNAIEPDSYVRPHRHVTPPKVEFFVLLQGRLAIFIFDEQGQIQETIILSEKSKNKGIDIKVGTWHSILALEPGTVVIEFKDGPYVPATDKDFAVWAPVEGTPEVQKYLENLKSYCISKGSLS